MRTGIELIMMKVIETKNRNRNETESKSNTK